MELATHRAQTACFRAFPVIVLGLALTLIAFASQTPEAGAAARKYCDAYELSRSKYRQCVAFYRKKKHSTDDRNRATLVDLEGATIATTSQGSTLDPDEPTLGGKMKTTLWYHYTPEDNGQLVIDTFGSNIFGADFDTVLAVYTGNNIKRLSRLASNDDTAVPGYQSKRSLVSLAVTKGLTYHIQVGGKNEDEGDVRLNVRQLPAAGGLTIALIDGFHNRDYYCPLGSGGLSNCEDARFVIHNSSTKSLNVNARSTLGPGVVAPAAFTLAPGATVTKTFSFSGFDTLTPRAVIGAFIFEGEGSGGFNATASHHALVNVKAASTAATLALKASPSLQSSRLNAYNTFRVNLKNTSGTAATGCHFRGYDQGWFYVRYQRVDAATGIPMGAPDRPFKLDPGASADFDVDVASGSDYEASPQFNGAAVADCANASPPAYNLHNRFDITATEDLTPASIVGKNLEPKGDVLNVPEGGEAGFRFSALNTGPDAELEVFASYLRPFGEDDPGLLFGSKICRTATASGPCLSAADTSLTYVAVKGEKSYFRMFVTSPVDDPGFDPGARRVYALFKQERSDGFGNVLIGTHSIAVKLQ